MSAYTSHNWFVDRPAWHPSDPRAGATSSLSLEERTREPRMEIKQNGRDHIEEVHNRSLPHFNKEPSPAFNRSANEDFQSRLSSSLPRNSCYSPPPRERLFHETPESARRRNSNNHIGPLRPPRQELTVKRGALRETRHVYRNAFPQPHSVGSEYQERRSLYFHNYRPIQKSRNSGISPYPQRANCVPDYLSGCLPEKRHHPQFERYQDLRDPRMNRQKSVDSQSERTSQCMDYSLQKNLDQIREEHSYCLLSSPKKNREPECKIQSSSNPFARHFLTPILKSTYVSTIQKSPVKVQSLTISEYWPVPDAFCYGNFSMDLDYDSGLDEGTSGDETNKELPTGGSSIHTSSSNKPKHLPQDSKQIRMDDTYDKPDDTPSKQVESANIQISETVSTEDCKSAHQRLSQPQQRKSKRLLRKMEKKTETQTHLQEVSEEMKRETPSPVSNELKSLLSGNFPPEILSARSRAESQALVRRKVMEREIEEHERERIQTAPKEADTDDSGVAMDGLYSSSSKLTNDTTSELSVATLSNSSVTLTSSGIVDMSQSKISDMEPRSLDFDSSLHDLESLSTISSDTSDFLPELVSRCKKIMYDRSSGDTPLHKVCRQGKLDMVRCLLFYLKADPNVCDNAGWTPLHEACSNNQLIIANLLLRSGADANASATDGTRPIHDAVEVGAINIVKTLVEHGADPSADLGEKTPLDLARENDQPEIYGYLKPIVQEYLARRKGLVMPLPTPAPMISNQKASRCKKVLDDEEDTKALPVVGYTKDDPSFGQELDFPLFYICPILELSETPMLPVYNFEVVSGPNPRKHNFYLLPELLKALSMNEAQLRKHCSQIAALELTVADFLSCIQKSDYVRPPATITTLSKNTKLKFLPVCSQLQTLLNIQTMDLDD